MRRLPLRLPFLRAFPLFVSIAAVLLLALFPAERVSAATTCTTSSYGSVGVVENGAPTAGSATFTYSALLSPLYFASGSSNGQCAQVYVGHRTVSASATDTLVLTGGTLSDPLGNTLTFTGVKGVFILADAANVATIVVGNAASHPFQGWFGGATNTEAVPAGGHLLHDNTGTPWTVTTGAADQIAVTNSSGTTQAGYTIIIWN